MSWLGGNDVIKQGTWQWATTTENLVYSNWDSYGGQPIIANGQYFGMSSGGLWYVITAAEQFICEWGGSAYKDYVGSAFLDDMNANGFPEIATLYTNHFEWTS